MNELRNILEESVMRLFGDTVDTALLTSAEETGLPAEFWHAAAEQGVPSVLTDAEKGGMGGTWGDAFTVIRACGRHAVPLPVPEANIAAYIAGRAGLDLPSGVPGLVTTAFSADEVADDTIHAVRYRVPWGRDADFFVAMTNAGGATECLIVADAISVVRLANIAGEPRDTVTFEGARIVARAAVSLPADAAHWLAAMARSAQIAGAGSECLARAVQYTGEREQFGRPLSKFQAIQHHLANMAGSLATVEAMSAAAFGAMDQRGFASTGSHDVRFDIAAAKCRASDAVESLTRIGHQVHGAIGFTYEYGLHFLTRRLWSWRAEYGAAGKWAEYLGRTAVQQGGDNIWAYMTD